MEARRSFGQQTYAAQQAGMQQVMLNWYIRTSDVTPHGLKDERDLPKDNLRTIKVGRMER